MGYYGGWFRARLFGGERIGGWRDDVGKLGWLLI
jgi:hypothetical protein